MQALRKKNIKKCRKEVDKENAKGSLVVRVAFVHGVTWGIISGECYIQSCKLCLRGSGEFKEGLRDARGKKSSEKS